jgi:hypothetical protein
MVLVVGMVFSLLTSSDGVGFKTAGFRFYSQFTPSTPNNFAAVRAVIAAIIAVKIEADSDGTVNVATNSPDLGGGCRRSLWRVLVAEQSPDGAGSDRTL